MSVYLDTFYSHCLYRSISAGLSCLQDWSYLFAKYFDMSMGLTLGNIFLDNSLTTKDKIATAFQNQ